MMFVCGQCWRNGQHSEADKNRKYCSAKARHTYEGGLGGSDGGGVYVMDEKKDSLFVSGGPKTPGWCS